MPTGPYGKTKKYSTLQTSTSILITLFIMFFCIMISSLIGIDTEEQAKAYYLVVLAFTLAGFAGANLSFGNENPKIYGLTFGRFQAVRVFAVATDIVATAIIMIFVRPDVFDVDGIFGMFVAAVLIYWCLSMFTSAIMHFGYLSHVNVD